MQLLSSNVTAATFILYLHTLRHKLIRITLPATQILFYLLTCNACTQNHSSLENSLLQSFFLWKPSTTKLQGIHSPIYPCISDWWGRPLLRENLADTDASPCKTPIFYLFSLIAPPSTVTTSKKVQITLIGSPTRASQWASDEHHTLLLSPKGWLKNSESKIWTISCDNSETVRDTMPISINQW